MLASHFTFYGKVLDLMTWTLYTWQKDLLCTWLNLEVLLQIDKCVGFTFCHGCGAAEPWILDHFQVLNHRVAPFSGLVHSHHAPIDCKLTLEPFVCIQHRGRGHNASRSKLPRIWSAVSTACLPGVKVNPSRITCLGQAEKLFKDLPFFINPELPFLLI